jgi:hypothetical protein
LIFILLPAWAKILASEGWTKKEVIEHVVRNSKSPFAHVKPPTPPLITNPEDVLILVAGGPGSLTALMRGMGGNLMQSSFVSKKIELPKNWDNLVAKYKNIVPTYVRY